MSYPKSSSKIYGVWSNMKERCDNSNYKSYKDYGGRGIKYDASWKSFHGFCDDMLSEYKEGLTLDRKDNEGNYTNSNCQWITNQQQQFNRRNNHNITWRGKTQTLTQWAREIGLKEKTLSARLIDYRWPLEKAMTSKLYVSNQFIESRIV